MMLNLFILLCLSAPTSAFVAQPQVAFRRTREGVGLASSHLDSLERKQKDVTQDTPTGKLLDESKFLGDMARELEAVDELTNKVGASIVPGAASERLERLVQRANRMCAKYDLECAELRASGVSKKAHRRTFGNVTPFAVLAVAIAAVMVVQIPTLVEQIPDIQQVNDVQDAVTSQMEVPQEIVGDNVSTMDYVF